MATRRVLVFQEDGRALEIGAKSTVQIWFRDIAGSIPIVTHI
jgi:hypothetical protein